MCLHYQTTHVPTSFLSSPHVIVCPVSCLALCFQIAVLWRAARYRFSLHQRRDSLGPRGQIVIHGDAAGLWHRRQSRHHLAGDHPYRRQRRAPSHQQGNLLWVRRRGPTVWNGYPGELKSINAKTGKISNLLRNLTKCELHRLCDWGRRVECVVVKLKYTLGQNVKFGQSRGPTLPLIYLQPMIQISTVIFFHGLIIQKIIKQQ